MAKNTGKTMKGEKTYLSILKEAENIFAELGYAAARIEDVAVAVGIQRASLIYYYRNKQEIFDAVETRIHKDLLESVERRLAAQSDPLLRLLAVLDGWLDFLSERTTAARIILRGSADLTLRSSNPVEFSGATVDLFEKIVRQGVDAKAFPPIDPLQLLNTVGAGIIFFACNGRNYGSSRGYQPSDPETRERFRQTLHKIVFALLSPAPRQKAAVRRDRLSAE
jgi:TetR/AcrR family transcriptional regulator